MLYKVGPQLLGRVATLPAGRHLAPTMTFHSFYSSLSAQGKRQLAPRTSKGLTFCSFSMQEARTPCPDSPVAENLRIRRQLALSYRLLDRLDLNEGVCNHLSAMAPARDGSGDEVMLVVPGCLPDGTSLSWSEVTASSLVGLNTEGKVVEEGNQGGFCEIAAASIHLGVRKVRSDAKTVMHLHSPYASALSLLSDPTILPVHQNSAMFTSRTAYYKEYAFADDPEEGLKIGQALGKDKDILIMSNHGTLTIARNIHQAFHDLYYLERFCMFQLQALAAAGGRKEGLCYLDEKTLRATEESFVKIQFEYSSRLFFAWWRKYAKEEPDVFL